MPTGDSVGEGVGGTGDAVGDEVGDVSVRLVVISTHDFTVASTVSGCQCDYHTIPMVQEHSI